MTTVIGLGAAYDAFPWQVAHFAGVGSLWWQAAQPSGRSNRRRPCEAPVS
jgi:hypothetical protein